MQRIRSHANGTGRTTAAAASRRCFLTDAMVGMAVGLALPRVGWSIQSQDGANETEEIIAVQALAQKAGLGEFSTSRKEHFLGLGDVPEAFRKTALGICESLSVAFLSHFRDQGFNLVMPAHPLTVITLKDKDSYGAFLGEDPGKMVGGHYDLDTNRLVMFDFRPTSDQDDLQADPERVNLLALVHETTHLLCFNTGLLSRQTDVPDWVSEGLATYVELWQKNKRPATPIGSVNRPWLLCLRASRSWICAPRPGCRRRDFLGCENAAALVRRELALGALPDEIEGSTAEISVVPRRAAQGRAGDCGESRRARRKTLRIAQEARS